MAIAQSGKILLISS